MSTDEIARAIYRESSSTEAMRNIPRFGHSRMFADLFGTEDEQADYLWGLIFAGVFLFVMFFMWCIMLLIFKCLGRRRVGPLLSGTAFVKANPNSMCNGPFMTRIIFVMSAIIFIIFSVLFVTEGLTNLKSTVSTFLDTAKDVNQIAQDVNKIITDIVGVANNTVNSRDFLLSTLRNGGKECLVDADAGSTADLEDIISTVTDTLTGLGNFSFGRAEEYKNSTQSIIEGAEDVNDAATNIEIGDWQALIIIVPYIIVPVLLIGGVALAWLKIDIPMIRPLLSWFVLPIFIIEVVLAYTLSSGILIAASLNADFCSGGEEDIPDATVIEIIEKLGYTSEDLLFQIAAWYIGQCVTNDPFTLISSYSAEVKAALADVTLFDNLAISANDTTVSEICIANITAMDALAGGLNDNIRTLAGSAFDALELLSCDNVVKLYTKPVYDGTCTYSIQGVTWAFGAFAVVGCMGLIMIMLRSAWQLDVDPASQFDSPDYGTGYDQEKGVEQELILDEENTPVPPPNGVEQSTPQADRGDNWLDNSEFEADVFLEDDASAFDGGNGGAAAPPNELLNGTEPAQAY